MSFTSLFTHLLTPLFSLSLFTLKRCKPSIATPYIYNSNHTLPSQVWSLRLMIMFSNNSASQSALEEIINTWLVTDTLLKIEFNSDSFNDLTAKNESRKQINHFLHALDNILEWAVFNQVIFRTTYWKPIKLLKCPLHEKCIWQPYHPAAQDWLPTEAKQGWAWSVPGWETSWEN